MGIGIVLCITCNYPRAGLTILTFLQKTNVNSPACSDKVSITRVDAGPALGMYVQLQYMNAEVAVRFLSPRLP